MTEARYQRRLRSTVSTLFLQPERVVFVIVLVVGELQVGQSLLQREPLVFVLVGGSQLRGAAPAALALGGRRGRGRGNVRAEVIHLCRDPGGRRRGGGDKSRALGALGAGPAAALDSAAVAARRRRRGGRGRAAAVVCAEAEVRRLQRRLFDHGGFLHGLCASLGLRLPRNVLLDGAEIQKARRGRLRRCHGGTWGVVLSTLGIRSSRRRRATQRRRRPSGGERSTRGSSSSAGHRRRVAAAGVAGPAVAAGTQRPRRVGSTPAPAFPSRLRCCRAVVVAAVTADGLNAVLVSLAGRRHRASSELDGGSDGIEPMLGLRWRGAYQIHGSRWLCQDGETDVRIRLVVFFC
mmetsp:Transcript_162727/g.517042  ORF Transcript_162727/g.517042 Transcript_162727/m.517042 type:complete len:349 (+) Transcript_162727:81-1127(+)